MRAVPQCPSSDLLVEERAARCDTTPSAAPAFIIDVVAGALLGANSAGWMAWGIDPANAAPPLALDGAMPALRHLREILDDPGSRRDEPLTFWTARGVVTFVCRVEAAGTGGTGASVTVLASEAGPSDGATAPVTAMPSAIAAGIQGRGADLDVALDAWLAHELRTPLSAVIAYAEVLKNEHLGPLANPRYQGYARDIHESARHALSVVDSLLRGDRTRTAVPPLAFADLDPVRVVESCLTVARPLAERAGLALGAVFAPRLPRIVADGLSLRQMLLNLLANAIKFARAGDRVTVAITYDGDGPLTISVADTGPGMDDAPKAELAGLGLGLPLTRALAAANGATLTIESAPDRGTCVTIAFPKDRVVPV